LTEEDEEVSDYTVISAVSETLRKLLDDNVADVEPVLSSPAEIEGGASPRLSLFLYQVVEDPYLKNQERQKINSDLLQPSPLTLELFYLLTPYARTPKDEQQILGRVMQIFYDNATLRGSILQGALAGSDEEFRLLLHPLSIDELIKLWNAFPEKPLKLSVCYQVTPVRIESTREAEAKRVIRKEDRYYR
jgi:hypothetical protein